MSRPTPFAEPIAWQNRTFKAGDLHINCLDYGGAAKSPLLFLHGGSACAHWWDFTAPAFTAKFHALAIDLRGHGDSGWSDAGHYQLLDFVGDLTTIVRGWGLGKPIVVGHSRGGLVGLLWASMDPQATRALVVIDSPARPHPQEAAFMAAALQWRPRRYTSLEEACARFRLLPPQTKATTEMLHHLARFAYRKDGDGTWVVKLDPRCRGRNPIDTFDHLSKIVCPTLIIQASDGVNSAEMARQMARAVPHGATVAVEGHHNLMLDNPRGLIRALNEFLAPFETPD